MKVRVSVATYVILSTVALLPDHAAPLYPQKLALTSPTGGGRSVGIVRSRTKATELVGCYTFRAVMAISLRLTRDVFVQGQDIAPILSVRIRVW
jgi:hypothetical protein